MVLKDIVAPATYGDKSMIQLFPWLKKGIFSFYSIGLSVIKHVWNILIPGCLNMY